MRRRLAVCAYRSQPRCRECLANDQIVPVSSVTTIATATSFVDSAVGLFPASSTFGQDTVKEGYAELVVPVLADLPAVKKFSKRVH